MGRLLHAVGMRRAVAIPLAGLSGLLTFASLLGTVGAVGGRVGGYSEYYNDILLSFYGLFTFSILAGAPAIVVFTIPIFLWLDNREKASQFNVILLGCVTVAPLALIIYIDPNTTWGRIRWVNASIVWALGAIASSIGLYVYRRSVRPPNLTSPG